MSVSQVEGRSAAHKMHMAPQSYRYFRAADVFNFVEVPRRKVCVGLNDMNMGIADKNRPAAYSRKAVIVQRCSSQPGAAKEFMIVTVAFPVACSFTHCSSPFLRDIFMIYSSVCLFVIKSVNVT